MELNTLHNQSVLLVGLGESGLACARWVLAQGARLTVVDTRVEPPGLAQLKDVDESVRCYLTLDEVSWSFDRVVVSPGLSPAHPLMQAVLRMAQERATPVDSELDLFADALLQLKQSQAYAPLIISITGTNGKTTTTKMVECLSNYAGKTAVAAGNISPAALEALQQAMQTGLPDVWVLELSSFQLHWTRRLHSHASVVLNVTQDHLDWHADMDEYAVDKGRIYSEYALSVVNRDDPVCAQMVLPTGASRVSVGLSAPMQVGDFGLVREGGMLWLAQANLAQEQSPKKRGQQEELELSQKLLMPTEALQVSGLHNVSNALAALALCHGLGMPMAKLLHGLRSYRGEPHRVEHVLQLDGIDFVDDSKGTNVGATVAALNGLARPIILIAGGDGKGQNFDPLKQAVSQHCKHVFLIGKDGPAIADVLAETQVPCVFVDTLDDAVVQAYAVAAPGDCVLLSPACASLDMFKGYAHRAEVFVSAVKDLALERGQPC